MSNCTLIEFVGIPYSWKTSTMNELQRNLRNQNAITYSVQEFRGAREFYEQRKLSPDVTNAVCVRHSTWRRNALATTGPNLESCLAARAWGKIGRAHV